MKKGVFISEEEHAELLRAVRIIIDESNKVLERGEFSGYSLEYINEQAKNMLSMFE